MATRFYLPSTGAADISPAFETGWTENSGADRLKAVLARNSSAMADKTAALSVSAGTRLLRQFVSADSLNAQTIAVGTVKGTMRVVESSSNDNILQATLSIRVVDGTGNTYRTPAVIAKGQYGPSTEWNWSGVRTARRIADGDATAQVVISAGDRLVIELGYYVASGTSISGTAVFGDDSGTDLGDNETDTAAYNPFVELSNTLTWIRTYSGTCAGTGSFAGGLSVLQAFSGTLSGTGALAGAVSPYRGFSGAAAGSGELAGSVLALRLLVGQGDGVGSLAGDLTVIAGGSFVAFSGTVSGTGELAGSIARIAGLSGDAAGAGSLVGDLDTLLAFAGELDGTGELAGDLTVIPAEGQTVEFAGDVYGTGELAGHFGLLIPIEGTAAGGATATASIVKDGVIHEIEGTAAGGSAAQFTLRFYDCEICEWIDGELEQRLRLIDRAMRDLAYRTRT